MDWIAGAADRLAVAAVSGVFCWCEAHHTHYTLIPPPTIDPNQKPIPMETKSRAWKEFIKANTS
jgi:hypothetical protein